MLFYRCLLKSLTSQKYRSILNTEEFLLAETEGSEEEDKENDKAEETPNESVLENKVIICSIYFAYYRCVVLLVSICVTFHV